MNEVSKKVENINDKIKSESKIDKNEAKGIILGILGDIFVMGANDREPGDIADILEKLDKGEIEPSEAVKSAMQIRDAKHGS